MLTGSPESNLIAICNCAAPLPDIRLIIVEPNFPVKTPTLDENGVIQLGPPDSPSPTDLDMFRRDVVPQIEWPRITTLSSFPYQPLFGDWGFGSFDVQHFGEDYLVSGNVSYIDSFFAKVHPDGTFDETFGDKGIVIFDTGGVDEVSMLRLHPDGMIYLFGGDFWSFVRNETDGYAFEDVARFFPNGRFDPSLGEGTGIVRLRSDPEVYMAILRSFDNYDARAMVATETPFAQRTVTESETQSLSLAQTQSDQTGATVGESAPLSQRAPEAHGSFGVQSTVGNQYASLASLLGPAATFDHTASSNVTNREPSSITTESSSLNFGSLAESGSPEGISETDASTEAFDNSSLPNGEPGPALDGPVSLKGIAPRITTPFDADVDALDSWWGCFGHLVASFWDSEAGEVK